MTPTDPKATEQLSQVLRHCQRRVMKRCFMTGKQCIFSSDLTVAVTPPSDKEVIPGVRNGVSPASVFIIMPFAPNLETFYRWSLKPYLMEGYGIPESRILRADEVRDIGYIVCEKICRKIQEADLVLADISLNNENVFYELGLVFGLQKPFALLQDGQSNKSVLKNACVRQSLGFSVSDDAKNLVFDYPGVGILDVRQETQRLHKFVRRPPAPRQSSKRLAISILRIVPPAVPESAGGSPPDAAAATARTSEDSDGLKFGQ